jgi:hypothetical protein
MPQEVPDHPTAGRWCKTCCEFKNLADFPPGKRRYKCARHKALSSAQRRREQSAKNPDAACYSKIWHLAYRDAKKSVFAPAVGGTKVFVGLADIRDLCQEACSKPSLALRIVPKDPTSGLNKDNITLVSKPGRSMLAKIWKVSKDIEIYTTALEKHCLVRWC